jgi:hypothetical protein
MTFVHRAPSAQATMRDQMVKASRRIADFQIGNYPSPGGYCTHVIQRAEINRFTRFVSHWRLECTWIRFPKMVPPLRKGTARVVKSALSLNAAKEIVNR